MGKARSAVPAFACGRHRRLIVSLSESGSGFEIQMLEVGT